MEQYGPARIIITPSKKISKKKNIFLNNWFFGRVYDARNPAREPQIISEYLYNVKNNSQQILHMHTYGTLFSKFSSKIE